MDSIYSFKFFIHLLTPIYNALGFPDPVLPLLSRCGGQASSAAPVSSPDFYTQLILGSGPDYADILGRVPVSRAPPLSFTDLPDRVI